MQKLQLTDVNGILPGLGHKTVNQGGTTIVISPLRKIADLSQGLFYCSGIPAFACEEPMYLVLKNQEQGGKQDD